MNDIKQNKMAVEPIKKLVREIGLPMVVSMVLQALGYAVKPLVLALLRLVVFVFPTAYLFTLGANVLDTVWWTFPIAEILTCVFAYAFFKRVTADKIETMK